MKSKIFLSIDLVALGLTISAQNTRTEKIYLGGKQISNDAY